MHSEANSKEHFPEPCFLLPSHNQSLCPSANQKIQIFCHSSTNFMKLSGLHSNSQRLNSHIFLVTSLVLTFVVWLSKSLAHPHKAKRKTQRAVLFEITQGCLRRYYLCLSQSTAKIACLAVRKNEITLSYAHKHPQP